MLNFIKRNKWWFIGGAVVVAALALTTNSKAAEADMAPVGVTQERVLESGDLEPFYSYTNSRFNGNSTSSHDFGVLVGVTDFLTVGGSTYYVDASSNGVGDFFVFGTANVGTLFGVDVRPSVGVVIPNNFDSREGVDVVSSGSYSLQPALTLLGDVGPFEAGAQYVGVFRLDDTSSGVRLGDENTAKAWVSAQMFDNVVVFAAGEAAFVGDTSGLRFETGSESVLLGGGVRLAAGGFEVSGEAYFPVYEDFDVASLNEQRVFRVGVQRAF